MLIQILFLNYFKQNYIEIISFITIIALIYPIQSVGLSRVYGNLFDIINKNTKFESFFDLKNILNKIYHGFNVFNCY